MNSPLSPDHEWQDPSSSSEWYVAVLVLEPRSARTPQDTRSSSHRQLLPIPRRRTRHTSRHLPWRQEPHLHRPRRWAARPARLSSPLLVSGGTGIGRRADAAPRSPPHPRRAPHRRRRGPLRISQRLGHASIRTTYDIYGHLFEGRDRQAADALEAARAQTLADSPRTLGRSEGPSLGL